jgi:hypothetical protein
LWRSNVKAIFDILSVSDGAKYFTITERLENEIIRGIIDTAAAAGNFDN